MHKVISETGSGVKVEAEAQYINDVLDEVRRAIADLSALTITIKIDTTD